MKIRLCLATTAAVLLMAAVSFPAQATLIPYTFSPDASMTFTEPSGSDVIHINGSFTLDTTTQKISPVSITLSCTGPDCPSPLHTTPASFSTALLSPDATTIQLPTSPSGDEAHIAFASSLANAGTIALATTASNGDSEINQTFASAVNGDAAAPTPASEPSSLALLAGVLGLFLLTRRSVRPRRPA